MQRRHAILALLVTGIAGVAAFGYLGSKGYLDPKVTPALANAYRTVETLASSASRELSPPASAAEAPDGGDAGLVAAAPIKQTGPLSSAQLSAPLVRGRFVTECGAPDDMKVVAKVTVKKGRAIAVGVTTTPPSASVAACVEKAVRQKQWDVSPHTQHATVTY
jgi:hypothetical protein